MNKSRQQELTRWLKQQSVLSRRWLMTSRLLGFVSGVLIIAQAWFLARILHHMIMENIPREALLLPFIQLVLIFIRESDNLGFDARTIAWPDTLNLSVEQGRIRQTFTQNPVYFFISVACPALKLL